jgi:hypothetical protein
MVKNGRSFLSDWAKNLVRSNISSKDKCPCVSSDTLGLETCRQARNSRNNVTKKCWKHDLTARASNVAEPNAIADEEVEPAVMTELPALRLCALVSGPVAVAVVDETVGDDDEDSGDDGDENDCVDEC